MIKVITTRRWRTLESERERLREDLAHAHADTRRAQRDAADVRGELESALDHMADLHEEAARLTGEVRALEEQARQPVRVYVLFHYEQVLSVHPTLEAAKQTAVAEGAPRDGWYKAAPDESASTSKWAISAYDLLSAAAAAVGGAA